MSKIIASNLQRFVDAQLETMPADVAEDIREGLDKDTASLDAYLNGDQLTIYINGIEIGTCKALELFRNDAASN